jgi:hypothetical protein
LTDIATQKEEYGMEKQVNEFVSKYGLEKAVALEITASHTYLQVEAILNFLNNYGQMLKVK